LEKRTGKEKAEKANKKQLFEMIYYSLLAIILFSYLFVSFKEKRFVNLLFFHLFYQGGLTIFPYCVNLTISKSLNNIRTGDIYLFIYYFFLTIIYTFIELTRPSIKVPKKKNCPPSVNVFHLLIIFLIVFFIANIKTISEAATNPRMYYANSRIGGGGIYYIVLPTIVFCYLLFLWKLDYGSKRRKFKTIIQVIISTILCFGVLYLFGQKAIILTAGITLLLIVYFKSPNNKRNLRFIFIALSVFVSMIIVFGLYSLQQGVQVSNILISIANYADYIPNFCDLVDSLNVHFYGKIFLEDSFFIYISRAVWPNKPTLFGSLTLGLYVPRLISWTKALTGAPSFGVIGAAYADFGFFGILLKLLYQFFFASLAKAYEEKASKENNFWYFMLFLTFAGHTIYYVTLETFPLYQMLVVLLLYFISKQDRTKHFNKTKLILKSAYNK